ncbi:MAG: DUF4349 domain-containing protein [Planctomycetota bacterium]
MRWMLASLFLCFSVACSSASARYEDAYDDAEAESYFESPAALSKNLDAAFDAARERGPALAENLPPDAAPARSVIYSAELRLVVVSALDAGDAVLAIAKEAGGWLQASDGNTITVRVPSETFERVLARLAKLGEVVARNVHAADVTEEMLDLDIRLENLQRARERLLEHLAKSDKMEDTLRIEAELTRVTGELERIEGRKRFLASQIAMSTITVELNSRSGGREETGLVVPFEWLLRLGDGLVAGSVEGRPRKPSIFADGPDFDAPEGFLRYYSSKELVEAMDAAGLRIKVQRQKNFDEGLLGFWKAMARRALVETRSLAVSEERELSPERALLVGTREVGGETHGYLLLILRQKRHVFTFEAWGPKDQFDAARAALEASAQSLED